MKTFLFDCETTGLRLPSLANINRQPYIIEFYGCVVDETTWQIVDEIEELISVPVPVTAEITKITGIKPDDLDGKPDFATFAPRIKTMIESCDRAVAHNCSFDKDMVDCDMGRVGLTLDWPEVFCTVEKTLHLQGHRLSLTALHERLFGEKFGNAHKARSDVEALLRCYKELRIEQEV